MNQLPFTILHVVISLETGGLERFVLDLINATASDVRHIVVCLERKGELAASCAAAEVISLDLRPGLQFGAVSRIAEIVKSNHISLIHTHNEKAQFYGTLAGLKTRVPVVHTKHGKNNLDFRSRIRNYLASLLCARVVAVSRDATLQCVRDERIPATKVLTILNGVDTVTFSPGSDSRFYKAALGIDPEVPVIGIVARLAPVKDHATLLAACQILRESGVNFRLLVVGDGPLKHELEARAESLGISDCVIFTGSRRNIPEFMRAMDVFVLSSVSEGISLTLIEAMSCELPVVATAVGGNPEVVLDGETGFLVPAQNPASMAEKIGLLLENPVLRSQFGLKGRQRAEGEFSLSRAAAQYVDLYRTVLEGNAP